MRGKIVAVAVLLFSAPSPGATIYTTAPIPQPYSAAAIGICDGNTIADHFTLTTAATVQSVSFTLLEQSAGSARIDWFFYSDSGGFPGAVISSGMATETRTTTFPFEESIGPTFYFFYDAAFTVTPTTLAADPIGWGFPIRTIPRSRTAWTPPRSGASCRKLR